MARGRGRERSSMREEIKEGIEALFRKQDVEDAVLRQLILLPEGEEAELLSKKADAVRQQIYGKKVFLRGLIEFTNYCKNNCYYCGIQRENKEADRYRLTKEEILSCCQSGYELGFRTFVLQGGEDLYWTDERLCPLVEKIRKRYPNCAITLSVGERSRDSYKKLREAGADRYLLRHETADEVHYKKLHPDEMSLENRKQCLYWLKELGYQVGSGFMVGSPYQTPENLISDLRFLQELSPHMIGIGPFIPHQKTRFKDEPQGTLRMTLNLISILRAMFPYALLPATTSLGTIAPNGRELGLKAGANVVMPNLSPVAYRKKYDLYDNKICTGEEAAECRACLKKRIESAGYTVACERGDAVAGPRE